MAIHMHVLTSAKSVASGRCLLVGRRAVLLADSRPRATLTRSIVERVSAQGSTTSSSSAYYATTTTATRAPERSSIIAPLRQVPLGRTSRACWNKGTRSLLQGGLNYRYRSFKSGCFLPSQKDELMKRGMWSRSAMQQQLPGAGGAEASKVFVLLPSPSWATQLAGLHTTATGTGGGDHSAGGDKHNKSQMGASSSSSATADAASCTRPPSAAASQEFPGGGGGATSDDQATRDGAEKVGYAGERGKGDGSTAGDGVPSGGDADAPRMADIRERLRDARLDASDRLRDARLDAADRLRDARLDVREDARDWIKDKRDDMSTMQETLRDTRRELRDAQREGRLREELSDQAKESRGKLRELWRKYGAVGIGVYFSIYFGSIAVFYGVYDYGVMTNLPSGGAAVIERMQEWMKDTPEWAHHYSDRLFGAMAEDHRARSFVLAWATCKVLEPLRLIASIAVTPRVARALGRAPSKGADDDNDDDLEERQAKETGEGRAGGGSVANKNREGGGGGDRH